MINLLLIPHAAARLVIDIVYAYTFGIWFVIFHPRQFVEFVAEWQRFRSRIADADDLRNSGYHEMNRRQRRSVTLAARKFSKRHA